MREAGGVVKVGMRRAVRLVRSAGCALLLGVSVAGADEIAPARWREDFRATPRDWEVRTKPGTKATDFTVVPATEEHDGALRATAADASAMYGVHLDHVDLRRTPILRWRWRVLELPAGADGRQRSLDDQAIGIYVGSGSIFRQKSIAYRWETNTPVGAEGEASYAGGIVKTKWFAVRNAGDPTGTFFVEERNVGRDFLQAFGFIPDEVSVSVVSNSQYTGTMAVAELDWIELTIPETSDPPGTPSDEDT